MAPAATVYSWGWDSSRRWWDKPQNHDQAPDDDAHGDANTHPDQEPAVDTMGTMWQMFGYMSTVQRQNQEQMSQMLQLQVLLQQRMLQVHEDAQKSHKKKSNPPPINGQSNNELELWLFNTEQYYSNYSGDMQSDSSEFSDIVFINLGPTVQSWYQDIKISLGDQPASWTIFKQRIRGRYREADFQRKRLSQLYKRLCRISTRLHDKIPGLAVPVWLLVFGSS